MKSVNPAYHHSNEQLLIELEWIKSAQTEPGKFAPLYNKYYDQIHGYVIQKLNDIDVARDVTSQVFLKAMKYIKGYKYQGVPFSSWLYRIAKSEINQSFRDRKKRLSVPFESYQVATFMETFKDEELEMNKEKLKFVLNKLSKNEKELINLRYFQFYAYKEIAEMLDISENNAKVKTFRVLNKLKKLFKES